MLETVSKATLFQILEYIHVYNENQNMCDQACMYSNSSIACLCWEKESYVKCDITPVHISAKTILSKVTLTHEHT